jgi:hypothetical protein
LNWRAFPSLIRLSLAGFTDGAVNIASVAWRHAAARGHLFVTTAHLLAAMATTDYRPTRTNLGRLGLDLRAYTHEVAELADPIRPGVPSRPLGFGPEVRSLLSKARLLARGMGHRYVGTEHVILALLPRFRLPGGRIPAGERGLSVRSWRLTAPNLALPRANKVVTLPFPSKEEKGRTSLARR